MISPLRRVEKLERAQGCLLGQLAGDALGSLVEFETPEQISRKFPNDVRELADGGTWSTIAGQPTDDSEMALLLARMLADQGRYDPEEARKAYLFWLDSGPFDCGMTISRGLRGRPNPDSQANGAMMRISPLGIFGANHDLQHVAEWARQDAAISPIPHPVCQQANALFTMAIAHAVRQGCDARCLYGQVVTWAEDMEVDGSLLEAVRGAAEAPPVDYVHQQGWVPDGFSQCPVAASACPESGGSRCGHRYARRRHRHQRRHLWRASWRCVGLERDSRPMDRMRAELPPCGRTTACTPSSSRVFLARGCFGAGGTRLTSIFPLGVNYLGRIYYFMVNLSTWCFRTGS